MAPLWKLAVAGMAVVVLSPLGAVAALAVAQRFGVEGFDPFDANTIYGRPLDGDHTETGLQWGFVVFAVAMLVSLVVVVALVTVVLRL
jgi:hypothetical protein